MFCFRFVRQSVKKERDFTNRACNIQPVTKILEIDTQSKVAATEAAAFV